MSRRITTAQKTVTQHAVECGRIQKLLSIVLLDGTYYAGRPPIKAICSNGDEFRIETNGQSILLSSSPAGVSVDCAGCHPDRRGACAVADPETQEGWSLAIRAALDVCRKSARCRDIVPEGAAEPIRMTG